jgi:aminoglycoside phosphotransferase family enzyme/predicted kinase
VIDYSFQNQAEFDDAPADSALLDGLLDARAYNHPTNNIEVLQTHISWVILTGLFAYKIRKPVNLGFVDFSTLAKRKHDCEEELRLNRRLSAQLYVGVVPIGMRQGILCVGATPAIEYAVKMHQFGTQDRLDQRIANNGVTLAQIEALARRVAAFHQSLSPVGDDSDFGSVSAIAEQIGDNLAQLDNAISRREAQEYQLLKLRSSAESQLHRHINALIERKQLGAIRECHGDLHTRNVVDIDGEYLPFDCLEFNASLRCIDVMSEVAFLMMDLTAWRRADLAYAFLNTYLATTGDYAGIEVLRLYLAYRCLVRAKVEAITDAQRVDKDVATYSSLTARYVRLAQTTLFDTDKPRLIVMHGYSGSGKSWVADRLSTEFPAIRLTSDIERKRMHGIGALAGSESGIDSELYSPEKTRDTYRRLAGIARDCLLEKFDVIVDAACLKKEQRMIFRDVARNAGGQFVLVTCTADRRVLEQRVASRERVGASISEAGPAVLEHQLSTTDPLTDHERVTAVVVATDTTVEIDQVKEQIQRANTS